MKTGGVTVQGVLIVAALIAIAYVVYKATSIGSSALKAASNAIDELATPPDANAAVQSNFQMFLADWKAAGKPPTGSPTETALRKKYSIPPAPPQPSAPAIANAGSSTGG